MTDNQVKIHLLAGIEGLTLLVFYTEDCWQFRVLTLDGAVFGERKVYYSTHAAEKAAWEWIHQNFYD
jgi:hypothetical protein